MNSVLCVSYFENDRLVSELFSETNVDFFQPNVFHEKLNFKKDKINTIVSSNHFQCCFDHEVCKLMTAFKDFMPSCNFFVVIVPHISAIIEPLRGGLYDLEDVLLPESESGTTFKEMLYGDPQSIKKNSSMSYKTSFTERSLQRKLQEAGWAPVVCVHYRYQLISISLSEETEWQHEQLKQNPIMLLGNFCLKNGLWVEAEKCYRYLFERFPNDVDLNVNLGFSLLMQRAFADAKFFLEAAVFLSDKNADAHRYLGMLLEATGQVEQAISLYQKSSEFDPKQSELCADLIFHAYLKSGQAEEAKNFLKQALNIFPDSYDFLCYLGNCYLNEGDYSGALLFYQKSLKINPSCELALINSGAICEELGDMVLAYHYFERAVSISSPELSAIGRLLFAAYFVGIRPERYLIYAKQYGEMLQEEIIPFRHDRCLKHKNTLKIGFVSADFLEHPVGFFIENIFFEMSKLPIEIILYSNNSIEDSLTCRLKKMNLRFVQIVDMSDAQVAHKIYQDQLDLLIDLSGHTVGHRLGVFAYKPAPVQATWLGYWASTGVKTMDYIIVDKNSVPENGINQFIEKAIFLPQTRLCFSPPSNAVSVTDLPSLKNRYITFASFQNVAKYHDRTLKAWANILRQLPDARLRLQAKYFSNPSYCESLCKRMNFLGIDTRRVDFVPPQSRQQYWTAYHEVDIVLDTFPFPGGTTTCEALWMGVPTLTLGGSSLIENQGVSLLKSVGLEQWIACSESDYIVKAVQYAHDQQALAELRMRLRDDLLKTPLFNAEIFTQDLVRVFYDMVSQSMHMDQAF